MATRGKQRNRIGERELLVADASPLPDGMVARKASRTYFRAEDSHEPGFFIEGNLDSGTLTFTVVALLGNRRGAFTGRQFFDAMMVHFGTRRVKVISAYWSDARPELSTNLKIFNDETRKGATKKDAAFATRTGEWARAYRFRAIRSIDTTPDDFPGGYEQVLVEFVRDKQVARPRKQRDSNAEPETGG